MSKSNFCKLFVFDLSQLLTVFFLTFRTDSQRTVISNKIFIIIIIERCGKIFVSIQEDSSGFYCGTGNTK